MSPRYLAAAAALTAVVLLVPHGSAAQSEDVPRTPWGAPDLQGVWDFATMTPMERPAQFAGKAILTEEDVAAAVESATNRWRFIAEGGDNSTGTYNEFWFDGGTTVTEDRRTSLITKPSDGRVPQLTPKAAERATARRAYLRDHPADSWEDRSIGERCVLGFNTGPPMSPSAYNNVVQLFQTEDHVVLLNEMVHDSRIVPLDNRPHLPPHMRQWHGDSRGYWDGDTLVVETVNFTNKTSFRGSSESMHLVERFTRSDTDTLSYAFTVTDPEAFGQPWTAVLPMKPSSGLLYEYACHEGNLAMDGMLAGTRADERAAMDAANR